MRLSASQIQTFVDCQRKWAWRYVAGVETPSSPAADTGKAVHAELEKYLHGGEIDFSSEIGYIAAAGLQFLPKPGTEGALIEQEFHFEGPSGHTYLGYKDLQIPGIIFDHKTTSNLKWQKTEDDLREDVQATLYATDYFRDHPDELDVELRWIYYQTKNAKKSAVTVIRVNQPETWNRFLKIEQIAQQMAVAFDRQPLELPANVDHCSAYGGCPHQGRCNLSPFERVRSHVSQNKLLMSLQNKKAAAATANGEAGTTASLAFAPGGVHHGVLPLPTPANSLLARLQAQGAPAAVPVNPPEYQPPPAAAPAAASAAAATAPAVAPPAAPAAAAAAAPPAAAATAPAPAALSAAPAPPVEPAARGRGRPKKATLPETGLVPKIDTLYVNCAPVGETVIDAVQLIVLAKKKIQEATGLADYRFAEFGQGPGLLSLAVVGELDALEGVLPAVRLDTTTPEGSIVAVELIARAGTVVR